VNAYRRELFPEIGGIVAIKSALNELTGQRGRTISPDGIETETEHFIRSGAPEEIWVAYRGFTSIYCSTIVHVAEQHAHALKSLNLIRLAYVA
jgi:hypothetical protein